MSEFDDNRDPLAFVPIFLVVVGVAIFSFHLGKRHRFRPVGIGFETGLVNSGISIKSGKPVWSFQGAVVTREEWGKDMEEWLMTKRAEQ